MLYSHYILPAPLLLCPNMSFRAPTGHFAALQCFFEIMTSVSVIFKYLMMLFHFAIKFAHFRAAMPIWLLSSSPALVIACLRMPSVISRSYLRHLARCDILMNRPNITEITNAAFGNAFAIVMIIDIKCALNLILRAFRSK